MFPHFRFSFIELVCLCVCKNLFFSIMSKHNASNVDSNWVPAYVWKWIRQTRFSQLDFKIPADLERTIGILESQWACNYWEGICIMSFLCYFFTKRIHVLIQMIIPSRVFSFQGFPFLVRLESSGIWTRINPLPKTSATNIHKSCSRLIQINYFKKKEKKRKEGEPLETPTCTWTYED
jgi:hypothetical protein